VVGARHSPDRVLSQKLKIKIRTILITCGGTFDPATGHYLSNTIVYTTEVS
jgi:hypothetical protein